MAAEYRAKTISYWNTVLCRCRFNLGIVRDRQTSTAGGRTDAAFSGFAGGASFAVVSRLALRSSPKGVNSEDLAPLLRFFDFPLSIAMERGSKGERCSVRKSPYGDISDLRCGKQQEELTDV
jgi:hypothetical protein